MHGADPRLALRGSVYEQLLDPIFVVDPSGALLDANPAAQQLLALDPNFVAEDLPSALAAQLGAWQTEVRAGRTFNRRVALTVNREPRRYECMVAPLRSAAGEPEGALLHLRRTDDAATASEARLHLALEAAGASVWDSNVVTGAAHFTDQWLEMLGYTPSEAPPSTSFWYSLVHPDDWPRVEASMLDHFAGRTQIYECELRLRTKSGEYRHILDRGKVVEWDADGRPVRMVGTETDITERKQAEESLHILLAKYTALFEMAPVGITITDDTGRIIEGNREAERILGLSQDEQQQRTHYGPEWQVIRPDGTHMPPEEFASMRAIVEGRRIDNVEMGIVLPEGAVSWISVSAAPITLPGYGVAAVYADITERRRLMDALRQSEAKFAKAFKANPAGIAITRHADGCYLDANTVYLAMLGYRHDELIGHSNEELGIVDGAYRAAILATLLPSDGTRTMDVKLVTKSGNSIDVILSLQNVELGGVMCILVMAVDVTERIAMEKALRKMNEQLEQRVQERTAQLGAANLELKRASQLKDEFLAAVSHELRTPLTGILAITNVLELELGDKLSDRQLRNVHTLQQSGERLLSQVNGILRYTRLLAGHREARYEICRLAELAAIALRKVQITVDAKRIRTEVSCEPAGLTVYTDADAIIDILVCLFDNATKFTPEDGCVGLQMRAADDARVQLVVWDTGIGISPEVHDRIFVPLVQGDGGLTRQFEGLGLGLAYVKHLVTALGGSIIYESEIGKGTCFTVTLPDRVTSDE